MEILIFQYALGILVCLWWLKPFKKVQLGKNRHVPFFNVACVSILAFIGVYTLLNAIKLREGTAEVAFLVLNTLLFCVVPASYLSLLLHFNHEKLGRKHLVHLAPLITYVAFFAAPYLFQNVGTQAENYFNVYGNFVMGVYIFLLVKFIFDKYASVLSLSKKSKNMMSQTENAVNRLPDLKIAEVSIGSVHLTGEQLAKMHDTVKNLFVTRQPFLQRGYSLKQLSEDTSIPLHHLSAFINQYYKVHFNDLINEYRVQYCQAKIRNDEWRSKTLEAIAEESGFNNRNTFTIAFKKATGYNPSDFVKMVKQHQIA